MSPTRTRQETHDAAAPWPGRAVLHVDMDAFFAAVEQLDHPEWRGLPVVVGGSADKRGVIAAASYEARRYGVRSAMPSAQAARLLPPEAVWTRGSFERYGEMSAAVFALFDAVTPDVQPASIDEAYLDVTSAAGGDPVAVAGAIQAAVDALGLSCSIGVAANKTVAKIASDHDKPHGITVVRPGEEAAFLAPMPVSVMPGIGPATTKRLASLGIRTLGQVAGLDEDTARQVFGSHGLEVVMRARGRDDSPVRIREDVKSVSNERTFAMDLRERGEVREALAGIAAQVSGRLRRKGLRGRTVHLKLRFGDFSTRTSQTTLRSATDSEKVIGAAAAGLLDQGWNPGVGVRLLGVGVSGFEDEPRQMRLATDDEPAGDERRDRVMETIEELRDRFGEDAVRFGMRKGARDPRTRYGPED